MGEGQGGREQRAVSCPGTWVSQAGSRNGFSHTFQGEKLKSAAEQNAKPKQKLESVNQWRETAPEHGGSLLGAKVSAGPPPAPRAQRGRHFLRGGRSHASPVRSLPSTEASRPAAPAGRCRGDHAPAERRLEAGGPFSSAHVK